MSTGMLRHEMFRERLVGFMAVSFFREACDRLAHATNRQLFDGERTFSWVGDTIGGTCDFDDNDFLSPEDMVRILDSGMTYDEYAEWRDANLDNDQYINLASWLKGLRHDMLKKEEKYK